jgi:hypothetical protein
MTTRSADWEIPRKVWYTLFSWGLAVLMIAEDPGPARDRDHK